jgi:hypothetical protein
MSLRIKGGMLTNLTVQLPKCPPITVTFCNGSTPNYPPITVTTAVLQLSTIVRPYYMYLLFINKNISVLGVNCGVLLSGLCTTPEVPK